jgi:hypothetical protein
VLKKMGKSEIPCLTFRRYISKLTNPPGVIRRLENVLLSESPVDFILDLPKPEDASTARPPI